MCVDAFGPVSFDLLEGEVLALAGLRSAGHEAIGRGLFGALEVGSGSIEVLGRKHRRGVRGAIRDGFGFVSGRRAQEGLASSLTVRENLYLNPAWVGARGLHWRGAERRGAKRLIDDFGIWPGDPERTVLTLSGGNQQKVVVARWVQAQSRILILEEPTAGVDVGAKAELYRAIAALLADGHSCILVSSDFDEVAGLAHRALVFDRGRIVEELAAERLTSEAISRYASGGHQVAAQRGQA
jgi:ribose transport system ATP-binding protein